MIVPDASIPASATGDDRPDGTRCRSLLRSCGEAFLPDFADVEAAAVLCKRYPVGMIGDDRLRAVLTALAALPFPRYPARPSLGRAYELRANLTPYDAVYAAPAEALDAEGVTADRRPAQAPGIRCRVRVVPG